MLNLAYYRESFEISRLLFDGFPDIVIQFSIYKNLLLLMKLRKNIIQQVEQ